MAEERVRYRKDHYHLYDEIVELLSAWVEAYPGLVQVESIGKSYEGRDIWCVTITDTEAGDPSDKPAYYIDANHHAGEVTGSAVALYTINYLLTNFGECDRVTRLLKEKTFYIIPRISVDGSEMYLTTPYMLRSSVREYSPWLKEGLVMEDVDGDGRILQMRVKNPNGKYKMSDKDPRLMVPRQPDDWEGDFYDMYIEGIIEDYDGFEVRPHRTKWGLDLNRNYPMNWYPETRQRGAGPYPLSEPETRAVADFILAHENIAGVMSYHTYGGIILRPKCAGADTTLEREDLQVLKQLGQRGEEITGYPCWSIFEKFTINKDKPSAGSFMDFAYDQLGIITFATELWDMRGRAGVKKLELKQMLEQTAKEYEQNNLTLLKWNDENFDGRLFVDWYEVEHPQLGVVELGGWEPKFGRQNPPHELLEEECQKNMLFTFAHAESLPQLELLNSEVKELGDGIHVVQADIANVGFLPTSGCKQGLKNKFVQPITAHINGDIEVVTGKHEQEMGHLDGFGKKRVKWVVSAKGGSREVEVVVSSQRAGVLRHVLKLN